MTTTYTSAIDSVLAALRYLASRCDGAQEQDGIGFSKPDSFLGKRLAAYETLTEPQIMEALDLLKKYAKSQLAEAGIVLPDLRIAREEALERQLLTGKIKRDGDSLIVDFLYSPSLVERVKSIKTKDGVQAAKFVGDLKAWRVPLAYGRDVLVTFPHFAIDPALKTLLETQTFEVLPDRRVTVKGEYLCVYFPYNPDLVNTIKAAAPGSRWNSPTTGCWNVPVQYVAALISALPGFVFDASVHALADKWIAAANADMKLSDELLTRVDPVLASGRTLFAHQISGVQFLLEKRRAILADDMGLGKSLQALVAAKAYALPVYVVCPASLRINWQREADIAGVAIETFSWAKLPASPTADFVLICDEAHYAQSIKSSRTKAMLTLAKSAHCKGLYLLTGTPIKNGRPANLYPLLVAIKAPVAANRRAYEQRYCDAHATPFSRWDISGASHLDELHEKCKDVMLRRMKKDCLDLPAKTRVLRSVELSVSAGKVYRSTLDGLRDSYDERVANGTISDVSEAIVMLNHLRHAGSVAKCETALEIAQDVIDSGQQIVLFVAFKDSGATLATALNCQLLSGDASTAERQHMVDDFQAGVTKALVCTHGAGGVGITLTAAQVVVLVDRPYTPGDAIQSEDRLHRIGQHNAVTAIWLQCGEVDEAIDQLLQTKQERIELVLNGKRKTMRGTGESITDIAQELLPLIFEK